MTAITAPTIRVDTRYGMGRTAMTSVASISSEMRIAPSSAVKPAPTCAASVIPAMSGVISRVFAKAETKPVKASAPISSRPLNPSSPTCVPVKKAMKKMTPPVPAPAIESAGTDGDVGDVADDLAPSS